MVLARCGQSFATDSSSLQQMPLFAVRNPTTFCKAKVEKRQILAAATLNNLNNGGFFFFLVQSTVVSFQFSLPSHFFLWSLCCYLYSESCFTGEVHDTASFASINRQLEDHSPDLRGCTHRFDFFFSARREIRPSFSNDPKEKSDKQHREEKKKKRT